MKAIIPAFEKFPQEAELVGSILAGYSSLEFNLLNLLEIAIDRITSAVKLLYRVRGEEQRISIADALLREKFEGSPLYGTYCEAIADLSWCRRIRNQYAHGYWELQGPLLGVSTHLVLVNLDELAKQNGNPNIFAYRKIIDLALLKSQAEYYLFVARCLSHLRDAHLHASGRSQDPISPLPKKATRPLLDNGTVPHSSLTPDSTPDS